MLPKSGKTHPSLILQQQKILKPIQYTTKKHLKPKKNGTNLIIPHLIHLTPPLPSSHLPQVSMPTLQCQKSLLAASFPRALVSRTPGQKGWSHFRPYHLSNPREIFAKAQRLEIGKTRGFYPGDQCDTVDG